MPDTTPEQTMRLPVGVHLHEHALKAASAHHNVQAGIATHAEKEKAKRQAKHHKDELSRELTQVNYDA